MTRYHLRYQLAPGQDPAALADFCAGHGVEEVVLIYNSEELHTGHPVGADEDLWFETVRAARDLLVDRGVSVSLNPWVTVGHVDRGRTQDVGFAPLVSPYGEVATAAASPACPVWREWLAAHYGRFAEIGFRVMWLEDDFRYHNHRPLTWGGGFEPGILERLGLDATREELLAAITAPGEPHPWRLLLQRRWREIQLEVVDLVRQAIGGRAKLGLMSSGLGIASVEGRDWGRMFERVEVHRPHFAPYGDTAAADLSYSLAMLELQRPLRPAGVEVAPEIENWPHTEWTKSDTQTWSEMVAAHLSGADALLLDVFPFVTGAPARYPRVGRMLTASRPALDATLTPDLTTYGVGVPWWQDTAASVEGDGSLRGLTADPLRAADFLLPYGVPIQGGAAPVTALFGEVAWGVPDPLELLRGGLLLDGTAAAILTRRGFGDLLGVRVETVVDRMTPSATPYSMERIVDGGALLSVNEQRRMARLVAEPGTDLWTEIVTARGEHWGAGRVAAVNALGGRVVTMAACEPERLGRCDDGRRLAHTAVAFAGADLPLVTGGPQLMAQYARVGGRWRLAVVNGSADPARPEVLLDRDPTAVLLAPLTEPRPVPVTRRAAGRVTVEADVPHRGYVLFEWD
ncbi:hypothetical protein ACQPYK_45250 [Streptosporangium sp. CA-135522]|uniref:hypothetical protein n=1 Tax=Streptosporangium sp. CA-135522 TaxID=3240072 RepID=UPI003D9062C2